MSSYSGILYLWGGIVLLHLIITQEGIWSALKDATIFTLALYLMAVGVVIILGHLSGDL